MMQRFRSLFAPLAGALARFRLPPAFMARLAPLRDRLAPVTANRALVGGAGLYLLTFSILLVLFTVVRFPADRLVVGAVAEANRMIAPQRIETGLVEGAPPLGARLHDVTLASPLGELMTFEIVTLRPALLAALTGRPGVNVAADLAGGALSATLRNHGFSAGAPLSVSFDADGIDTARIGALGLSPWAKVSGRLSGDGDVTVDPADGTTLDGDIRLLVRGATVTLSTALFPEAAPIRIDEVLLEATASEGKAAIATGSVRGAEIQGTVTGDVSLAKNLSFSRLNLTVAATLTGDLQKRLGPFLAMLPGGAGGDGSKVQLSITGTVVRPVVK